MLEQVGTLLAPRFNQHKYDYWAKNLFLRQRIFNDYNFSQKTGAGFPNVEAEGNTFEQMEEKLDGFINENIWINYIFDWRRKSGQREKGSVKNLSHIY